MTASRGSSGGSPSNATKQKVISDFKKFTVVKELTQTAKKPPMPGDPVVMARKQAEHLTKLV